MYDGALPQAVYGICLQLQSQCGSCTELSHHLRTDMLASALRRLLAAGPLVIRWTVAKAERLSRESSVGLACAEAASGVLRPLPGLTESSSNVRHQCAIEADAAL